MKVLDMAKAQGDAAQINEIKRRDSREEIRIKRNEFLSLIRDHSNEFPEDYGFLASIREAVFAQVDGVIRETSKEDEKGALALGAEQIELLRTDR